MSGHSHSHNHEHHSVDLKNLNKAFYIGIGLNISFVVIEAVCGWYFDSLALLSDAGHNLSDVASLILSLVAFKMLKKKATEQFTYGYRKATILASLINAILLFFAVGFIIYEAIGRFFNPEPLSGKMVAIVAFVGIIINGATAWLFMKDKENDLNIKGAYLHMLYDALVSVAVVIGGIIIFYTSWFWVDAVLSIIVALVIIFGTWSLLTKSLKLSLDGVPENINIQNIKYEISKISGVEDFQHIHIWALSTTENALTGHLRVSDKLSSEQVELLKNKVKHELEHLNIQHSTLETYCCDKEFGEEII